MSTHEIKAIKRVRNSSYEHIEVKIEGDNETNSMENLLKSWLLPWWKEAWKRSQVELNKYNGAENRETLTKVL